MRILKILEILEPYMDEFQKEYSFWTEHDILGFQVDPENISEEDLEKLKDLGVFYDKDYESLIMFT